MSMHTSSHPAGAMPPQQDSRLIAARLERLPVGAWHRKLTALVGVGAFYEYFEVFLGGVLAAVLGPLWGLSTFETAALIGSVFAGMFVGALTLGRLADKVGRKRMFLFNLSLYLAFSLVAAFSPTVWVLIACRFVAGVGAGAEAALIPTYLGEFIPRHRRGRYIGYAFTLAFIAYPVIALVGAPLAQAHFLIEGWRWLLVIGASGVFALLWMRRGLPESPRWLVSVGRWDDAEAELSRIEEQVAATTGKPLPAVDYSSLPTEVSNTQGKRIGLADLFRGNTRNAMLAVGSLWTLGVLAYYGFASLAPLLLVDKGYDITKSLLYTAVIAAGYPLGAVTAAIVAERFERRTIAITAGLATASAGLVFGYGAGDGIIMAAGFAVGFLSNIQSSCVNMYAAEVFPTRLRSTAIGLCYGAGRLFALAMPFLGMVIIDTLGGTAVILLSAVLYITTAAVVWLFGPRTTGRSLEDITETA